MAKAAISQEEDQLRKRARRRLVGAAFLVLVMIIVLPMILDSEPRPQAESVRVQMPAPQPEHVAPPKVKSPEGQSVAPATSPAPETLTSNAPMAPASPEPAPAKGNQSAVSAAQQDNIPDPPGVTKVAEEEAKPSQPLVIQLGAFAKPENAQQLKNDLAANHIQAFSEVVTVGKMSKTRVRAGPFETMPEAEKAREQIVKMKLNLGMDPKIVARGE